MTSPFLFAKISKTFSQIAGESVPLVKGAQRQQTSIRTDLPTRKISSNGPVSVEGKGELWYTTRCHFGCSKRECWVRLKPGVHQSFRAPFLFSPAKSSIIQARKPNRPVPIRRYHDNSVRSSGVSRSPGRDRDP